MSSNLLRSMEAVGCPVDGKPSKAMSSDDDSSLWLLLREAEHDPFESVVNTLNDVLHNHELDKVVFDMLVFALNQLVCVRRKFEAMPQLKKLLKIQKKLDLTDVYAMVNAHKIKKSTGMDENLVNYILQQYTAGQVDPVMPTKTHHSVQSQYKYDNEEQEHIIPKYNLSIINRDEVAAMLEDPNWQSDLFRLHGFTNCRSLTFVTYSIFQTRGFFQPGKINADTFMDFIMKLEDMYDPNLSYHNSIHAADVTVSINHMLKLPAIAKKVTDLEVFALLVACAAHDVDHPGVSNSFLVNTKHELANLYYESPCERHHIYTVEHILKNERWDITKHLNSKEHRQFFQMMEAFIIGTDCTKHNMHLENLAKMTYDVADGSLAMSNDFGKRSQFLSSLVHMCDIGNPTKKFDLYEIWIDRIMNEFFNQGDQEEIRGIPISPMCNSKTTNVTECQIGFINFLVMPTWILMENLISPEIQEIMDNLRTNKSILIKRSRKELSSDTTTETTVTSDETSEADLYSSSSS